MPANKLTIVPVKLDPLPTEASSFHSSQYNAAPGCVIKTAVADEGAEKSMKRDFSSVQNIYIICGKTDMRKGIDGLATLIQDSFELDPYSDSRIKKLEAENKQLKEANKRLLGNLYSEI